VESEFFSPRSPRLRVKRGTLAKKDLAIQRPSPGLSVPRSMQHALHAWADATTDASSRRRADLLHDKIHLVGNFFAWVKKPAHAVTPIDIKAWQAELETGGLSPATVYAAVSRLSSFYTWAMRSPELAAAIRSNPVTLARPKAPKAYQTKSTQSLDDRDLRELVRTVRTHAATGDLVGKRDYAMLLLYILTGMRRAEVVNLCWGDVKIDGIMVLTVKVKGGEYMNRQVTEPAARAALLDYLDASGRMGSLSPESPLWTRHDRAGSPGSALNSHSFVKNLKAYATEAGIGNIHLHQTRHTYARIVAEESGSLVETQDALGHRNLATTRVYVQRVGVKKDRFSSRVAKRLEEE